MPLTDKKKASNAKWDAANLKRTSLALKIDLYDRMQKHIAKTGETVNGFLTRAIDVTIELDNQSKSDDR